MQDIANSQKCLCTHIYSTSFNVCIGAVRKPRTLSNLCLCHPHALTYRQQFVSDGSQIKNQHFSSSKFLYIGIILLYNLDKQEA